MNRLRGIDSLATENSLELIAASWDSIPLRSFGFVKVN
jgi:hypothetical protein